MRREKFGAYLSRMKDNSFLEDVKRLKAIADIGLLYANNDYDKERYLELQELSFRLLHKLSGHDKIMLSETFPLVKDYPTAKVDTRALILSGDKKILLVKEQNDGGWALPGGWAEIGFSPSETIVKECKEETGLDVEPQKLLAVFDKRKHPHPPESLYVFKLVFYCTALSTEFYKGFDVLDIGYFAIDDLPPLSEMRILKSQIEIVYQKMIMGDERVYFD
ncbi:NUDIX hydrolase N-terminal domain-containing protein [Flavisolibacter ginsenosidimutans]|nr:NUDIX hydrolase N-terminal domain-containing protein [Flavisolibacter ginsenosidimutans]